MKNLFFFLLLFSLQFTYSQAPIVQWRGKVVDNNPTVKPTYLINTPDAGNTSTTIGAADVSGSNINFTHNPYNGFYGSNWPSATTPDASKYISLQVFPKSGYQLYVNKLVFKYKGGCKRMRVSYSKNASFTDATHFDYSGLNPNNNEIEQEVNFPSTINVLFGQTLYIRISGYESNGSQWGVQANPNTPAGPLLYGSVASFNPSVIMANHDTFMTNAGEAINLNVLFNDYSPAATPVSGISITTSPLATQGTVVINPNKTITFNPAAGFTGTATFSYLITNGVGTASANVTITVAPVSDSTIIIWNGEAQATTPKSFNANVTGNNISGTGINFSNPWHGFRCENLPVSLDYNRYVQMVVNANASAKVNLSQFKFTYRSDSNENHGPRKYQVRYSFDPSFPGNGTALASETTAVLNVDTNVTLNFPQGTTISPNQSLYIRLYLYDVNQYYSNYYIKHDNGGTLGPAIIGYVRNQSGLIAHDDSYTVTQTTILNVLANDVLGVTPITSITASVPTNAAGTVTVNPDKTLTFTPAADYEGNSTFTYTLFNGTEYSTATVRLTANAANSTTWTGSAWTNGAPNSTVKAVIAGNYNTMTNGNINANSLHVNGSATAVIAPNTMITVQTDVKVTGNLTIESGGSLVQVEDNGTAQINGSGSVYVKRKTTPIKQYDYTYWSLPVQGAPVNASTNYSASIFYTYNPASGWVWTSDNATVAPGTGFISMAPENLTYNPTQTIEVNFVGVPNTGTITKAAGVGANLIGNPYPSALDADKFITANPNITGTIYLWTHNSAMQWACDGCAASSYTADDYATYNLTGSLRTSPNGVMPSGKIATGQGFFVQAATAGTLTFNNSMRVTTPASNNDFYRPGTSANSETASPVGDEFIKSRMWFTLTNDQGAYAQSLFGHITGATDGLDNGFDGELMEGGNFVTLYTLLGDKKLAIQGRGANFDENQVIPVGFKSTMGGTLTIAIENVDGLFTNQDVYLVDNVTNTTTNLKNGSYTFTSAAGTFNDRFQLRFVDSTLGTDVPVLGKNDIVVIRNAGQVEVRSSVENLSSVLVYDLTGKQISASNNISSNHFATSNLTASGQVVLVKVVTENNRELVQKVILK